MPPPQVTEFDALRLYGFTLDCGGHAQRAVPVLPSAGRSESQRLLRPRRHTPSTFALHSSSLISLSEWMKDTGMSAWTWPIRSSMGLLAQP
ncbi:hypothetical protein EYF80_066439 [Liparis tanakae]|uniref:Uncharacterized protein n=1 Tax=Liparis tanakae TaxID=230148 RepID=A0A4Z2E3W8_9TELE|nr:hypothetical protein EYF80_066439 [Liparis tanakae]